MAEKQTNKQDNLQQSINQMQSSMNAILTMFKEDKERENTNKRSAPHINIDPIKSPNRKQKTNQTNLLSYTPTENNREYNFTQHDEEASNPPNMSQNTFSEESVDETMSNYASSEGEGQWWVEEIQ